MITGVLAFIHARKWLVELILAAVVVAGVYLYCQYLIGVGVQRQKDDDAREIESQRKALTARAETASHAHDQELLELTSYVNSHPLHGSLCKPSAVPAASTAVSSDAGAAASAGGVQPVSAGDTGASGRGDPDVRHLLDIFARRADEVTAAGREWQGR